MVNSRMLYLVYYIRTSSYDISLNLDVIRKASRTSFFPEIQDWRLKMKMLYNMGQLLSVSLLSVERVFRSFRRARTGCDTKGRSHQSCILY